MLQREGLGTREPRAHGPPGTCLSGAVTQGGFRMASGARGPQAPWLSQETGPSHRQASGPRGGGGATRAISRHRTHFLPGPGRRRDGVAAAPLPVPVQGVPALGSPASRGGRAGASAAENPVSPSPPPARHHPKV